MTSLNRSHVDIFGEEDLAEKFSRIYTQGCISLDEYYDLGNVISASSHAEEIDLISRLHHAVKRGWVKTVPQQS